MKGLLPSGKKDPHDLSIYHRIEILRKKIKETEIRYENAMKRGDYKKAEALAKELSKLNGELRKLMLEAKAYESEFGFNSYDDKKKL
ncbi:MAG: hypothetical protein ACP5G1_02735 [Nanopusillaceae archaeon]